MPRAEKLDPGLSETFWVRFKSLYEGGRLGGTTEEVVAAALGIDQAAVSRFLHRRRGPTLVQVTKVARLAGVSVDWLLGMPRAKGPTVIPSGVDAKLAQRFIDELRAAAKTGETIFAQFQRAGAKTAAKEAD